MAHGETYEEFVEKFKPKKTTDDCYTPPIVYDAVADWVAAEYHLDRQTFVRPFWPGGDYERFDYPADSVVVDNPPFSIISRIVRHYLNAGIRFFLFSPTLTLFSGHEKQACYIPCGVQIVYENGAVVNTSFVTNLDTFQLRTAPTLYRAVKAANDANHRQQVKTPPSYQYPPHVLTAAAAYQLSKHGVDFRVKPDECVFIRTLDAMREKKKSGIFGSALLLSDRVAAERNAIATNVKFSGGGTLNGIFPSEKKTSWQGWDLMECQTSGAEVWPLSPRELDIVTLLNTGKRIPANCQEL